MILLKDNMGLHVLRGTVSQEPLSFINTHTSLCKSFVNSRIFFPRNTEEVSVLRKQIGEQGRGETADLVCNVGCCLP